VQGTRILLLEDDRETRWALATVLRREGCRVTEAGNGEEGLRFLVRSAFDLCISDVCMPGMGGFGFFAAVRFGENPELLPRRNVPIMLLSGKVPTRELAQALDAGVDEFLEKPVDPEEFKARIRAVLRRARSGAAPSARTSGNLSDFCMGALAQTLNMAGRSARLKVQHGQVTALLDFQRGQIKNASIDGPSLEAKGDAAAVEALGIQYGTFEILPIPDAVPHTVFLDTASLILRAATRTDEVALQADACKTRTTEIDQAAVQAAIDNALKEVAPVQAVPPAEPVEPAQ
jgi:DNA-binding response OmpR family regulator